MNRSRATLAVGDLVRADPYELHNNPALNQLPFVGIYLGREIDPSGWRPGKHRVLGPSGHVSLWTNQWHVERLPDVATCLDM